MRISKGTEFYIKDLEITPKRKNVKLTDIKLLGNVDVLKNEKEDERYNHLNISFLEACKKSAGSGQSLEPLLKQYRQYIAQINKSKEKNKRKSAIKSETYRFDLKFLFKGPNFEATEPKKVNKTPKKSSMDYFDRTTHTCPQSEIYRFLVQCFGVSCPNKEFHDKFVESMETLKANELMSDFPFSNPPDISQCRGLGFSMAKREDIGNNNRRIFDAIVERRKDTNALAYVKNPVFFDESSEEDEIIGDLHLLREQVQCYYYYWNEYKLLPEMILRIFKRRGQTYLNLRHNRYFVFKELNSKEASITYSKGEDCVYILAMKTMIIYKISCRHSYLAHKIYQLFYTETENLN